MKPTLQAVKEHGEFKCNISHLNRMCDKVKETPAKVYDIIEEYNGNADSVTRETIFQYLTAKYYDGDYQVIYQQWMRG